MNNVDNLIVVKQWDNTFQRIMILCENRFDFRKLVEFSRNDIKYHIRPIGRHIQ